MPSLTTSLMVIPRSAAITFSRRRCSLLKSTEMRTVSSPSTVSADCLVRFFATGRVDIDAYARKGIKCNALRRYMTDTLTKQERAALMARVRQKDTAPEVALRRKLHAAGLRYVLHSKSLPGRPDIAFPKFRAVIFVHGCFWHGHDCRAGRVPSSNRAFWLDKVRQNQARDARKTLELQESGWRVLTVWECQIRSGALDETVRNAVSWLRTQTGEQFSTAMALSCSPT